MNNKQIIVIIVLGVAISFGISYASTNDSVLSTNGSPQTKTSFARSDSYMVNYPESITMFGSGLNNMQGVIQFNTTNSGYYNSPSVERMRIGTTGDVIIPSGEKIYIDGGSNTYIVQGSTGEADFYANGAKTFAISGGNSYNFGNSLLSTNASPQSKFSFARSDTNMINYPESITMFGSGLNNMQGVIQFNTTNSGYYNSPSVERMRIGTTGDVIIPSGEKIYIDGGSNTYIVQGSDGTMDFFSGNTKEMSIGSDICIGSC